MQIFKCDQENSYHHYDVALSICIHEKRRLFVNLKYALKTTLPNTFKQDTFIQADVDSYIRSAHFFLGKLANFCNGSWFAHLQRITILWIFGLYVNLSKRKIGFIFLILTVTNKYKLKFASFFWFLIYMWMIAAKITPKSYATAIKTFINYPT